MIKKLIAALVIALPICASAQKFGVVDGESLLPQMPEYTAAENQLSEASKKYEAELTNLREELDKKYADFQQLSQDPDTPQSIKDRRLQELTELDQKVQQFVQTAQQDIQRQQAQLMQPIQEKLLRAINTVGQNNNFTILFPIGVALYTGQEVIDATPLVKAELGL
ncbi:MAG: OmpH family outer membrane protein [Muribaculaceae bacterium]|nr:OmpH family outer membrane protein [Muribaculaceae bacterium]